MSLAEVALSIAAFCSSDKFFTLKQKTFHSQVRKTRIAEDSTRFRRPDSSRTANPRILMSPPFACRKGSRTMFVSKGKVQIQLSDLAAYSMVADVSDFILRSVHMSTFFLKQLSFSKPVLLYIAKGQCRSS